MNGQPLTEAFDDEHHRIDTGIDEFIDSVAAGRPDPDALRTAFDDLRRLILLEEDHLFPPLRDGATAAPLTVLEREHGTLWRLMDTAEALVDTDPAAAAARCAQLSAELAGHRAAEQSDLYPEADRALLGPEAAELLDLMDTEVLARGRVCQALR